MVSKVIIQLYVFQIMKQTKQYFLKHFDDNF